jgi:hypothetical protein
LEAAVGVYSEYLDRNLDFESLCAERKKQLKRISGYRNGRDILVYAADLNKSNAAISISYSDVLPFNDQLSNLKGKKLDLILETPGGSGEAAEDMVRVLRDKYEDVAVIVPGWAKSAGTLMTMAADEILMGKASALGPIDAQLSWQGKVFSADALIEGLDKIKEEVGTGVLNKAYIPILQGISPGEIQSARNALKFAETLVTEWLAKYKFKDWNVHASSGQPVTQEEKTNRAREIGVELRDHGKWLTHGRSLKIQDLRGLRLKITDYTENADLNDAITRYYTLLQMAFSSNIYKVIETTDSQIYRFLLPQSGQEISKKAKSEGKAIVEVECLKCNTLHKLQANIGKPQPLENGCLAFPADNKLSCTKCGNLLDLVELRRQIEGQTKGKVAT